MVSPDVIQLNEQKGGLYATSNGEWDPGLL